MNRSRIPKAPTPARPRRKWMVRPRFSTDSRTRSIQVGILGTLLVHLLIILLVPHLLDMGGVHDMAQLPPLQQFSIQLAPEEAPAVVPPKPPSHFVETNPNVPENVPDHTDNFSSRNQQVAQEKPSVQVGSDRPALEGSKTIKSDQIVSGQLHPPHPPQLPVPPTPKPVSPRPEQTEHREQREQNPLPGYEQKVGNDQESYGSNVAKTAPRASDVKEKRDGKPDAPLSPNDNGLYAQINPNQPLPRPRLTSAPPVRPAIFSENPIGTANIGPTAVDARWSNYGQYLQQMIEAVQVQWDNILRQSQVYPTPGTMVVVTFVMDSKGAITNIVKVDGTAGDQAKQACISAITLPAPYGPWTSDMTAVLGDSQQMTFSFYYQ